MKCLYTQDGEATVVLSGDKISYRIDRDTDESELRIERDGTFLFFEDTNGERTTSWRFQHHELIPLPEPYAIWQMMEFAAVALGLALKALVTLTEDSFHTEFVNQELR